MNIVIALFLVIPLILITLLFFFLIPQLVEDQDIEKTIKFYKTLIKKLKGK